MNQHSPTPNPDDLKARVERKRRDPEFRKGLETNMEIHAELLERLKDS